MQLYPDWSSRANTTRGKKRKRKQETNDGGTELMKQTRPQPDLPVFSFCCMSIVNLQSGKETHQLLAYILLEGKREFFRFRVPILLNQVM